MNEEQVLLEVIERLKKTDCKKAIDQLTTSENGLNLLKYIVFETIEVITDELSKE
jgi:EAL domain-containing protein (putative c-di-GMP-specific phosphodiesterase class I)